MLYIVTEEFPGANPARYAELTAWAKEFAEWYYSTKDVKTLLTGMREVNPSTYERVIPFRNPDFARRQAAGEIVVAPYIKEHIEVTYLDKPDFKNVTPKYVHGWFHQGNEPKGAPKIKVPFREGSYWNYILVYVYTEKPATDITTFPVIVPSPFRGWDEEVFKVQITSALAEANSGEWDALTSLAEARETIAFIADKINSAVRTILSLRRGPKNVFDTLKSNARQGVTTSGSAWLEYRYAISPLIMEAEDIMSAFEALGDLYSKTKVSEVNNYEVSHTGSWEKVTDVAKVKSTVMIKRRYDPSTILSAMDQVIHFNPFTTAWELIPLSFVIDWFINIGDFIAASAAIPDYCEQGSTLGIRVYRDGTYKYGTFSTAMLKENSYYRRVIPNPSASLSFNTDLSWRRQIDALALSWGLTRSKLSSFKSL